MSLSFEASDCILTLDEREKIVFVGDVPVRPNIGVLAKTKGYKTFKLSVEVLWTASYPVNHCLNVLYMTGAHRLQRGDRFFTIYENASSTPTPVHIAVSRFDGADIHSRCDAYPKINAWNQFVFYQKEMQNGKLSQIFTLNGEVVLKTEINAQDAWIGGVTVKIGHDPVHPPVEEMRVRNLIYERDSDTDASEYK